VSACDNAARHLASLLSCSIIRNPYDDNKSAGGPAGREGVCDARDSGQRGGHHGGSGGIGKELARYWLAQGGKVLLADIGVEALEKAKAELGATRRCSPWTSRRRQTARAGRFCRGDLRADQPSGALCGIIRDGLMVATDRETGKVAAKWR